MAQDKGLPDWAKFLDYNNIDSAQKQQFLEEVMQETAQDIARDIARDITSLIQQYFEKQKEGDTFRMAIARAEGKIVVAALAKRFGSYQKAVDRGLLLGVYKREEERADGQTRLRHRFVWLEGGNHIPLVDITIDINGSIFDINHVSHVGTLSL